MSRPVLRRRGLIAGVVTATVLALVPAIHAFSAGSLTVAFNLSSDWGNGHEVHPTVTNGTGSAVASWRIEFDLPAGTTISSFWDADVVHSGNLYTATQKSWAGPLAPGASFTWGYIGTGAFHGPTTCAINGGACGGGTTQPSPSSSTPGN